MDVQMPLQGLRVIELSIWAQGPITGMLLAGMGAEVIVLEKPGIGASARGVYMHHRRKVSLPGGRSLIWEMCNCNKKSVTLDLYKSEGRKVLHRLVGESDVFLTNLTKSALREFEADYDAIRQCNPKIIYAQAGGFGLRGPEAEAPCQDTIGLARAGFLFKCPNADGSPRLPMAGTSDTISATMLSFGILAALIARDRLGISQMVYAGQLSSMIWVQLFNMALIANFGYDYPVFDRTMTKNPLLNFFKCADGKWIVLGLFVTDRLWPNLCRAMGLESLEKDPRFDSELSRAEYSAELVNILDRVFASKSSQELAPKFREEGIWFTVANWPVDVINDPQVVANEYITEFENGLKFVSYPFELEKTKVPLKRGAPELGQHTEEVLLEVGECSWEEIGKLREQGVI